MKTRSSLLYLLLACSFTACKEWVEPPISKHQIEQAQVFTDTTTATSALLGIYHHLGTPTGATYVNFKYLSLYADEYQYTAANTDILQFAQSRLGDVNTHNSALWNTSYSAIYQANALIEGLQQSDLPEANQKSMMAEARFLRAYAYFYLWQLYENIPLLLNSDVQENRTAKQAAPSAVTEQIYNDLSYAQAHLPKTYKGSGRVRANSYAATALLARFQLYQKQWQKALDQTEAFLSTNLYELPRAEDVFLSGSKEAILQFWSANGFTGDASTIVPASTTVLPSYTLSEDFYLQYANTDTRRDKWIGRNTVTTAGVPKTHYYPAKYKNRAANTLRPEHVMAIRLAEIHLIRAEALARLERYTEAQAELNKLRQRANATLYSNLNDQSACLSAIERERRLELFGEWGHRFLDLKRNGQLDATLGHKTGWDGQRNQRLPLPANEIIYNPNLKQNHGY